MKQIQPVSIWYNGIMVMATIFNMNSINDNLTSSATFYYQIFAIVNETEKNVAEGNLTMTGFDYEAYSTSPDSNSYAYQWGATQLNLTLI
jgi:hypothetical protein